jgi:hypothetical protein
MAAEVHLFRERPFLEIFYKGLRTASSRLAPRSRILPAFEIDRTSMEVTMKKLVIGVAVLPFLAGIASASQPKPLNDAQMDTVTAGALNAGITATGAVSTAITAPHAVNTAITEWEALSLCHCSFADLHPGLLYTVTASVSRP